MATAALDPDPKLPPPEQFLFYLARSKRHGVSFEVAWRGAGRRVRWPHDTATRLDWKDAMDDTREAWETAYNEMPSALPALTDRVIELVA